MVKISIDDYQFHIAPLIDACEKKNCHEYWNIIQEQKATKGSKRLEILTLFNKIVSYALTPDSPNEPLKEYFMFQGHRSPMPSELTTEERDFLQQVLPEIKDSELKARVADTLWTLRHGKAQEHAKTAIEAYLISADILLEESWHDAWERLTRAFRIFNSIGLSNKKVYKNKIPKKLDASKKISAYIENANTPHHLVVRLVGLLHAKYRPNTLKHAKILETIAAAYETESNYDSAQHVWKLTAGLYQQSENTDDMIRCQVNAAETYVLLADDIQATQNPSYARISHFLQSSVDAYRFIPNKPAKTQRNIQSLGFDAQSNIKDEMQSFSIETDCSELAEEVMQCFSGLGLREALRKFAYVAKPPNFENTKKEVEKQAQESFFSSMFGSQYHNRQGHVIAQIPTNAAPELKMHRYIADSYRKSSVIAILSPALHKIKHEHHISLSDWAGLFRDCPFIPPERMNTYAYGLFHGFHGDFLSAAHILIPQIENSIRYVLTNHGIETSKQMDDGTQEQDSFKKILEYKELEVIFGKDLVFDLQGLLIKKEGANLRNNLLHGLMDDDEMFNAEMVYLYWLTIHIIAVSFRNARATTPDPQ